MKTKSNLSIALFLLVLTVTGCSLVNRIKEASGSGSSANTNSNSANVAENTGIPECDKLFAKIEEKLSDKDGETTFIQRAAYQIIKDQVMQPIRDDIANKTAKDKKELARKCTEAYDKLMEDEEKDANKK
jgi:hypothetical protein